MDNADSVRYHLARARLLVDCLADSPQAVRPEVLETTLRMIRAELALAEGVLERPPPSRLGRQRWFVQRVPWQ